MMHIDPRSPFVTPWMLITTYFQTILAILKSKMSQTLAKEKIADDRIIFRYGALRKLHEIGGIAPPGNTKGERKNKDGFVNIKV